jgi:hypothetical protein
VARHLAWALLFALATGRVAAAQDTHLVVVTGVGGSDEHTAKFQKWSSAIIDSAKKVGVADANILSLSAQAEADGAAARTRATRENVSKALADLATRARPDDEIFVVLIGHGTFDGQRASFNLVGPDLTAEDYALLLDRLSAQRVVFVNTASSSGAFLKPLAGPGRVIVTGTRSGGERNETRFPEFLVEALQGNAADRDRNGRVSVLEAFDFAKAKVAATYEQSGHIVTEHASLEDGSEGKLAATLFLAPPRSRTAAMASADPALKTLVEERDALERQVSDLRLKKATMDAATYEMELERLVTELALKTRAVREAEAKK